MPAENIQKLKILHLLRLLWTETDAQCGLTMTQIIAKLGEAGIKTERKSIYRDIEALRDFGIEVAVYPGKPVQYAIVKEGLGFDEIMLLVDAVQGTKFISEQKCAQLVKDVKALASQREQALLNKRVHVEGRIKNQSKSVFSNVDILHEAMAAKRKVSFSYCRYGTDLKLHPTKDPETKRTKTYVQTPVKVVFANGYYYLAAYSDNQEKMLTFRIDRMKQLEITEQKATRNKTISAYAYEDFEYQAFEMFDGEPMEVTLHTKAEGMGVIVDRFGQDIEVTDATEDACDVHVTVRMSPLFHGWLASMSDIIKLAGPRSAVEAHEAWLRELGER